MIVTKIEQQRNNEKRYSIFIDGLFAFGLSDVDVLYYKIVEQKEISQEQYDFLVKHVVFTKAKDKALHFLGYRARTEKEICQKLREEDYVDEIIEDVIMFLRQYNYVNDEEFAREYAKNRVKFKGLGKSRIKQELRQKGIEQQIIDLVLAESDTDETEMAIEHLNKKQRGTPIEDEKTKRRCFDFLLRRGFSFEVANQAIRQYINDSNE